MLLVGLLAAAGTTAMSQQQSQPTPPAPAAAGQPASDQPSQPTFRGGINFYRNFHRNWEITPELADRKVSQPTTFIAGQRDGVIGGATPEQLTTTMSRVVTDFRGVTLIPDAGHWVQQEKAEETNAAIVAFLSGLSRAKTGD